MSPELTRFSGRCKLLFFGAKPLTRRELGSHLAGYFPLATTVDLPSFPTAQELSASLQSQMPKFCFAEVASVRDPVLDLIPGLIKFDAKMGIVAILPSNDPDLILRCLRLGANDFLIPPFTPEQVAATVQKLIKLLPASVASVAPGKLYCVIPAKGACGSTTLACDLAYQWKRLGSNRVLLGDLDPVTGVVSFLLKLKSQFSFLDVLQREADMDADLWRAMVTSRHGVDVLLAPETLQDGSIELTDASPILDHARYNYDVSVIDAGSAYGEWTLSQALLSDEVILVTTNELSSLQAAQRVLTYLEAHGIGRWKIRLVVNRYDRNLGLSQEMIASALHTEVFHILPSDYQTVQRALLESKPIPPSSNFGKSMAALAQRLGGRSEAPRKASSFSGLLSLFSRTST